MYTKICGESARPTLCFIRTWREPLIEFIPKAVVDRVLGLLVLKKELDLEDVRVSMESQIGRELFDAESKKLRYKLFIQNVKEKLNDLVHCDFADSWISNLRRLHWMNIVISANMQRHKTPKCKSNVLQTFCSCKVFVKW